MTSTATGTRPNQRRRTRKDLLQAAARLMKSGRTPTLEDIAAEALVSRATAYRYFAGVEPLLVEASLDIAIPDASDLFRRAPPDDAVARLDCVDTALTEAILANEASMRMMLVHTLQQRLKDADQELPARQNRRTPLIAAALKPASKSFKPGSLDLLTKALALVIGTEAMIVFKDVLQLDDASARKVRRWAIRALVDAARNPNVQK